jgi:hypothetical protein
MGEVPDFGVGYSEAEILDYETRLGLRLPEDLRAVYRTIRQDMCGLLGMFCVLSLDRVVELRETDGPRHYA